MRMKAFLFLWTCAIAGCGPDPILDKVTYDDLILEGWLSYSLSEYDNSMVWFEKAVKRDSTRAEAFTGLAWVSMQNGALMEAAGFFGRGIGKSDLRADHYGGWSFLEHDLRHFEASNSYADSALSRSPAWSFPYAAGIGAADLVLLKAWNYFLMGNYNQSMATVKAFNPSFNADVSTAMGQQQLAREIERLRGLTKRSFT